MPTYIQPWSLPAQDVLTKMKTVETGLTETEVGIRLAKYGNNKFYTKEKTSGFSILLKQFLSPLVFLLIGAGTLTLILGEWVDTIGIVFAVLINVLLGFFHEYHAENTLDKLTTYIKDRARVVRNGREQEIESSLLVPGDIIKLAYGSRVPADARILTVNNLQVDEAILTGESIPVPKIEDPVLLTSEVAERKNIVHAGTLVVQGYAMAVIYATGNNTEIGKVAGIVSKINRVPTPLQKGVGRLAWIVFVVVIVIVIMIFWLGVSRGGSVIEMLILSAAVAVGAVPEALPIVLTVILAIGAERIASKKGVIRKLTAAETLGSTTLIMTDKTGTLTLADMQLVGINTFDSILNKPLKEADGKKYSPEQKKLLELALLNLDVSVENPTEAKDKWVFRGRPFEVNIAKACHLHGVPIDVIPSVSSYLILPFNSTNKFSVAEKDGSYVVMGAPDILLQISNIPKEEFLQIESWIEATSREGKRLIGVATFPKPRGKEKHLTYGDVSGLKFLGMFSFYDPIRKEVPAAIKNIESHGVKMVLVTGDLVGTALAVAKSIDWAVDENEVLTGVDLRKMSDEDLYNIIPQIKIFARVTPEDKLRIGRLYQKHGEIVAMTGDGVNDAPALKAMDIGISLGSGSDVAKAASDLVLLDDNFETISLAIDEGRRILSNIRKMFVYLMSNSLDDVFVVGGSLIMGIAMPLTALQIIWVNLFTGSLSAVAFAFDENMDREKSVGKSSRIIFTKEVTVLTVGVGLLSSFFVFLLYYLLIKIGLSVILARTIFFVCFSSYVMAVSFSFRSLHQPLFAYDVFSNSKLNWSILVGVGLLVFTMVSSFMRDIFNLVPLPLVWIPFIFVWLVMNVLLVEGAKFLLRERKKIS